MEYFTAKQAAEKWGITANRVTILCKGGKIAGAIQIGSQWMIPNGTEKPQDGRTKQGKADVNNDFFRFPLFINAEADAFSPPLTDDELTLRQAQLDYYTCRFDNARQTLIALVQRSQNVRIKIMSLFFLASLSVEAFGGEEFLTYTRQLHAELANEATRQKDMMVVIPWLHTIMVQNKAVSDSLAVDPTYEYSPTVRPLIAVLSMYHLSNVTPEVLETIHLDVYEMLCAQLLQSGHYYEACELHFLLFLVYYVLNKEKEMLFHLRKGLTLVQQRQLYIIAASYESYYQNAFDAVLCEFPADFVKTIKTNSAKISNSIGLYTLKYHDSALYSTLSKNDYRYLIYAFQGKTNREVARVLHVSERTVANHYTEIYDKLGVNNKQALAKMIEASLTSQQNEHGQ